MKALNKCFPLLSVLSLLDTAFANVDISWVLDNTASSLYKETILSNCTFTYVLKLFKQNSTVCFKFALSVPTDDWQGKKKAVRWISKNNINELLKLKLQELMKLVKHKNH